MARSRKQNAGFILMKYFPLSLTNITVKIMLYALVFLGKKMEGGNYRQFVDGRITMRKEDLK